MAEDGEDIQVPGATDAEAPGGSEDLAGRVDALEQMVGELLRVVEGVHRRMNESDPRLGEEGWAGGDPQTQHG